jgi:hypothetical protein
LQGIAGWLLVDLGINWLGWAVSAALKVRCLFLASNLAYTSHSPHPLTSALHALARLQTEKFFDGVGSLSFTTLTAGSLALSGPLNGRKVRERACSSTTAIWV